MFRCHRLLAAALVAVGVAPAPLRAQAPDPHPVSFTASLNQDTFFGFYPTFSGTYGLSGDLDVAFYGILWTIPAFGLGGGGQNLWTEVGAGVRLHALDDHLFIRPQLGITNGSLLSGGTADGGAAFLDGVVPSLTVNYAGARFEGEWYSGYYIAARRPEGNTTYDYLHFWVNGGVKFARILSVGPHYEQLENTRVTGGDGSTIYQWLGGYVQVALRNNMSFRFTAGSDVSDGAVGDFYKLQANLAF